MSEFVQIDATDKKLSKSEAIREALSVLGSEATAVDVQKHAEKATGGEIDIRTVYQIKSNMKTGRDATTKSAPKQPKAAKPAKAAKPKADKQPKAEQKTVEDHEGFGEFSKLCKLLDLVKEFGGPERFMQVINKFAI